MPYQLKYRVDVEWIGAGIGPLPANSQKFTMIQSTANTPATQSPLAGPIVGGGGTGGAINGTDVTTLTNAMAVDIAAQMNANLTQLAAWISGGG